MRASEDFETTSNNILGDRMQRSTSMYVPTLSSAKDQQKHFNYLHSNNMESGVSTDSKAAKILLE